MAEHLPPPPPPGPSAGQLSGGGRTDAPSAPSEGQAIERLNTFPGGSIPEHVAMDPEVRELIEDLLQELRERCKDLNSLVFARCVKPPSWLEARAERLISRR